MTDSNSPKINNDFDQTAPTVPLTPDDTADPTERPAPAAENPAQAAETPAPAARAAETPAAMKRRPLFPTILWGAMMLAVAAFFAARELVPGGLDLVTWLLTAVVGIGLLLVVAGIAAASRRAG